MSTKRSWLAIAFLFTFIAVGVAGASYFIRGYRPDIKNHILTSTGLLVANSQPRGASVFVNDKLVTATDDTVDLAPDEYRVKIVKDGFLPWEKTIAIKKEIVKQTEAHLFKNAPDLKPITSVGAINPTTSPDGAKVVYAVASASAQTKNGVWVNDLSSQPLNIARNDNWQIARNGIQQNWEDAQYVWSPDSKQVLAYFIVNDAVQAAYLLPADRLTDADQLRDVSFNLNSTIAQWEQEKQELLEAKIKGFPKELYEMATNSAKLITFSPNEEKFFYLTTEDITLPDNIFPHPPARSDQPEQRELKANSLYVYDLKEDTNFLLGDAEKLNINLDMLKEGESIVDRLQRLNFQPVYWLATSRHVTFLNDNRIKVIEYDATNEQTLFAGPFINGFAYPWPDGNRLLILTSLYSDLPPNLYAVTIK